MEIFDYTNWPLCTRRPLTGEEEKGVREMELNSDKDGSRSSAQSSDEGRTLRVHDLKTWPGYFVKVMTGEKTFELRTNDRDFHVGDTLLLREYEPYVGYTGQETARRVTYIAQGVFGLPDDVCVMSIAALNAEQPTTPETTRANQNADQDRDIDSELDEPF